MHTFHAFVLTGSKSKTLMCSRVAFATRVVVVASNIAVCRLDECTICGTGEEATCFKSRGKAEVTISEAVKGPRGVVIPEGCGPNSRAVVQYNATVPQSRQTDGHNENSFNRQQTALVGHCVVD